jgi:NADH-quinone oxidoreductase subunit N
MGVVVMNQEGFEAALYYLAAYYFMNLGAFGFLLYFHGATGKETYESLRGMGWRAPAISIAMVVFLISLTGIPPTIGFYGKLKLFYASFERYPWLVVVAGLNSVVSLFYYIKVARYLFLAEPAEETPAPQPVFVGLIVALAVVTVIAGVYVSPLVDWAAASLDILATR